MLTASGKLKMEMDESEDILVLVALMDVNLPKFALNDIPLFKSITSDLFPGVHLPERNQNDLIEALKDVCIKENLIA